MERNSGILSPRVTDDVVVQTWPFFVLSHDSAEALVENLAYCLVDRQVLLCLDPDCKQSLRVFQYLIHGNGLDHRLFLIVTRQEIVQVLEQLDGRDNYIVTADSETSEDLKKRMEEYAFFTNRS